MLEPFPLVSVGWYSYAPLIRPPTLLNGTGSAWILAGCCSGEQSLYIYHKGNYHTRP